jgi:hypothetical protein
MNERYTDILALLHACIDEAVRELCEGFGYPVIDGARTHPLRATGQAIASTIQYNGGVSGALSVVGSAEILRALFEPTGVTLAEIADLTDAAGELTNMLLGRIKHKCAAYDVTFAIGTPTIVHGTDLLLTRTSPTTSSSVFDVAHGRLLVRLDSEIAEDMTREVVRVEYEDLVSEGAVLMFD